MNAERLKAIIDFLLDIEKQANIQANLEALASGLRELSSSLNPDTQASVALQTEQLFKAVTATLGNLSPAQRNSIKEVSAQDHFSVHLPTKVRQIMVDNAMTPAIALQRIQELIDDRKSYLNVLRNTRSGLRNLGIQAAQLNPGDADISVLLPRNLFHNDLDGLQRELKTLSSIIRTFYELSSVTPGAIEVKEISTSDPTFFLGVDVAPLIALGLVIKWCIDVIKGSHDIKKIADNARKAGVTDEVVRKIEEDMQKQIDAKVDEKVAQLLEKFGGDIGRRNELEKPARLAIEQLLQRIERGLVIEIHASPPASSGEAPSNGSFESFSELTEIARSLEYPEIGVEPVLQLMRGDDTDSASPPRADKPNNLE